MSRVAGELRHFRELPPLALYIHLPWCLRKCPYCDFNSHEARGDIPDSAYVDALLTDLSAEMPLIWGRSISTVFIGGGTPSLFPAAALDRLLSGIRALTGLSPGVEITLEANPGTAEQARFRDYRALGINRLSIGVQSFDDRMLSAIGRVHSSAEAIRAIEMATQAGFERINLDLMFGLPEQSLSSALQDVRTALSYDTGHLSCYELTLEPNTLFARFPPVLPGDDLRADMQDAIVEQLAAAGYARYEVSAYARAGEACAHNLNYWQFGDYVGIGAGAHGKLSLADSGRIVRRWKQKHPARYLDSTAGTHLGGETPIPVADTALEFMMNALRMVDGFPLPLFERHTGVSLSRWQAVIDTAQRDGLMEQRGLSLRATDAGQRWLNELLQRFMPDNASEPAHRYPVIPLLRE